MTLSDTTTLTVALVGNPNTGKSTVFNALAGMRERVGNYPGVTVEKKTAELVHGDMRFLLVDLPGTYSLAPRSPDEMVAVDVLLGRRDDVRREQPGTEPLPCQPGARVGPPHGGGAEHGRRGRGARY